MINMRNRSNNMTLQGFTLVEMLLVMVIVGILMFAGIRYIEQRTLQMRIDRTALQSQQILNAGLAYYVNNSTWPTNLACLYGNIAAPCAIAYLPTPASGTMNNPWGQPYQVANSNQLFYVYSSVTQNAKNTTIGTAQSEASVIAGELPLSYTSVDTSSTPPDPTQPCTSAGACNVVAAVNIPGQNLNNADAVTFAGVYHHGGCVPVPVCPVDPNGNNLIPQIMVVPLSVSGVNDASPNNSNVYPISSFTAYSTSNNGNAVPPAPTTPTDDQPPACDAAGSAVTTCYLRMVRQLPRVLIGARACK